jgi:hypothetical protein
VRRTVLFGTILVKSFALHDRIQKGTFNIDYIKFLNLTYFIYQTLVECLPYASYCSKYFTKKISFYESGFWQETDGALKLDKWE